MPGPSYPKTRTEDVVDERAGIEFPDPYRWLESDTDEVREWQRAQGELAAAYVRDWPHFDALRDSVSRFSAARFGSVPRFAGGRWFRMTQREGSEAQLPVVAEEPFGEGRVLFDPSTESADQPALVTWISPSPDAGTLALGVCTDGSEANTIRLVDVATGELLPDPPPQLLMDNWTGGAQWLPDSSGFFFLAVERATMKRQVMLHRRLPVPGTEPTSLPVSRDYTQVTVSAEGRWAVAHHALMEPNPIAVLDLSDPRADWRPFVSDAGGTLAGHVIGDCYYAVTSIDAPRGRVVAIPLDSVNPDDSAAWIEIVPESEAAIRSLTPVGDRLYVNELVDTFSHVRVFDTQGKPQGEVPLPGRGAIDEMPFPLMNLSPEGHPGEFLFAYSSLVQSWGVYRHRPGAAEIETLEEPAVRLEGAVFDSRWATSEDGTKIPFHVLRLEETDTSRPQPTLIYAYGGFNAPWLTVFPNAMASFVAAGGIYVHGHLRGGGEFGLEWWQGGRMENKQNCYDDLYAIAEQLFASGVTTRDLLGVTGGSNGGLMSGVAITQRPDLWRVVIPRVPLLDVIGSCRDPYGLGATTAEFGDPRDPEQVRRLASFSPYHLVEDGATYPAMFIDAGDTDPRCPAWHARKFTARMQAANASDQPMLVRIWENVGHGWATPREIQVTENTEWLAFVMRQLGMTPEGGS
jgi:prolyl oligopeptidase